MKKWMLRLGLYVLRQFILALGVSLSIISGLGVSPASSVALAFSLVTGVEVGNMMILVQGVYFLLQCLFFEREFKLLFFLQLPSAILFGKLLTLTNLLLEGIQVSGYAMQLGILLLSVFVVGLGLELYMGADVAVQPAEGLVSHGAKKWGRSVAFMKNCFDIGCVLLTVLVSWIGLGAVAGVREGTVLCALGTGRAIWLYHKLFGERLSCWLHEKETPAAAKAN